MKLTCKKIQLPKLEKILVRASSERVKWVILERKEALKRSRKVTKKTKISSSRASPFRVRLNKIRF